MDAHTHEKSSVATLAVVTNTILTITKLVVGLLIGSVSVIAEAVHSGVDLIAAVMALVAVRVSGRPPDEGHPYGHGKIENVTGTIEAVLILGAAALIVVESVEKLLYGAELENVDWGLAVIGLSVVVNFFVSRRLLAVAKKTDSVALEADAYHLTTDVLTSVGVFVGLLLVRITGLSFLDPLVALGVAVLIVKTAWDVTKHAFVDLLDRSLPDEEQAVIRKIIERHIGAENSVLVDYHSLRSRKAGPYRHIDVHLEVHRGTSVEDAHAMCDHLEEHIEEALRPINVTMHVEPCQTECVVCYYRPEPDAPTPQRRIE